MFAAISQGAEIRYSVGKAAQQDVLHAQLELTRLGERESVLRQQRRSPAWGTNLNTGESISAESAVYVEGGDVQYCTHGDSPVARGPDGVSVRKSDRCLPTLVGFKTQREAEAYREQHGGRLSTYKGALRSVRGE